MNEQQGIENDQRPRPSLQVGFSRPMPVSCIELICTGSVRLESLGCQSSANRKRNRRDSSRICLDMVGQPVIFPHPFHEGRTPGTPALAGGCSGENLSAVPHCGGEKRLASKEMRVMRTRIGWFLLAAALWLAPSSVS